MVPGETLVSATTEEGGLVLAGVVGDGRVVGAVWGRWGEKIGYCKEGNYSNVFVERGGSRPKATVRNVLLTVESSSDLVRMDGGSECKNGW